MSPVWNPATGLGGERYAEGPPTGAGNAFPVSRKHAATGRGRMVNGRYSPAEGRERTLRVPRKDVFLERLATDVLRRYRGLREVGRPALGDLLSRRRGISFSFLTGGYGLGPERGTPPELGPYEDLDRFWFETRCHLVATAGSHSG